jgi:hypothetical protein
LLLTVIPKYLPIGIAPMSANSSNYCKQMTKFKFI